MLCHGIRNGMQCQLCRRDLADGAPIYRFRAGRRGGATAIRCSDCAAGMTFWNWGPPSPCEGCGRPVSYRRDYRFRHHVTCGQPVCLLAVRAAAARARREPAELHCRMCGRLVPSKRPDTLYCSSPCRQRAYRRRLAAVVTPPAAPLRAAPRPLASLASCPPPFGGTYASWVCSASLGVASAVARRPGPSRLTLWESGGIRCSSRRSGRHRFTTPTIPYRSEPEAAQHGSRPPHGLTGPPAGNRRPPAPLSPPPAVPGAT